MEKERTHESQIFTPEEIRQIERFLAVGREYEKTGDKTVWNR